jgi:hypothetical protein
MMGSLGRLFLDLVGQDSFLRITLINTALELPHKEVSLWDGDVPRIR